MEMTKFNNMLETDILRNSSLKILGVFRLRGAFLVFGRPKRHPAGYDHGSKVTTTLYILGTV